MDPRAAYDFGADYERDLADQDRWLAAEAVSRRGFLASAGKAAAAMGTFGLCFRQLGLSEGFGRRFAALPVAPEPAASIPAAPPTTAAPDIALTDADRREWQIFKRRFVSPDGRVIDTGNNCVSHTEGQGWGMLFAVAFDDQATFDRLHGWTQRVLRRSGDALHCWRYDPSAANPVADANNASDGDIFIAWALWRAACRWGRPADAGAARAVARDILALLVREAGERTVLLPAAAGFESACAVDVNPSYYCFQALTELSQALPSPIWDKLQTDGLALIAEGRFGQWQLPPDWLSVSRDSPLLAPAAGWPARFSYDAIRVPLYLAWARRPLPELHRAFANYWSETDPRTPAWVDLHTGATASYPAPPGMVAIAKVATAAAKTSLPAGFPSIHTSPDYYSSALILLSRLAWHESREG